VKHISRSGFREQLEQREVASGALRRLALALIVILIQSIIMGTLVWGVARILMAEDVISRWISWAGCAQITFLVMLLRVMWLVAHGRGGNDDDQS
jgi:hypothetical protein